MTARIDVMITTHVITDMMTMIATEASIMASIKGNMDTDSIMVRMGDVITDSSF